MKMARMDESPVDDPLYGVDRPMCLWITICGGRMGWDGKEALQEILIKLVCVCVG